MAKGKNDDDHLLEEECSVERFALIPEERKEAFIKHVEGRPLLKLDELEIAEDERGVYLLYIVNPSSHYGLLAKRGQDIPVYVGKAEKSTLKGRLAHHALSMEAGQDIDPKDIRCRFVPMEKREDIASAEQLLLSYYNPIWNTFLTGFGNKVVGSNREGQTPSRWDTVHPGRKRTAAEGKDSAYRAEVLQELQKEIEKRIANLT